MSNYIYTYKTILAKARSIKKNVETDYKLGEASSWGYYIAKCILNPKKDVTKIKIKSASKPAGSNISRQIFKTSYISLAGDYVEYVESNGQSPNNLKFTTNSGKTYNIRLRDLIYMFSRILVFYEDNKQYPKYANVNSKAFTKPTEYPNKVYGLWVKYIGTKPKCLDDVCDYILKHFDYEFYFDDQKSNEEVLKTKSGNCTDLLQMLTNMADAMDYEWVVYHVKCRQSGTGHVYGKFRKKDGSTGWFTRDVACIADESRYCVWCDSDVGKGYLQAKNPSWFLANRNR